MITTMCSRRNSIISALFLTRYSILYLIIFLDITFGVADRYDTCSSLCGDFIESPALPAPFPTQLPNDIEPYDDGGGGLQGRGYTYPSPFVRVYDGPVRSEAERKKGVPILTEIWDIVGLPRFHNVSGYTGIDGYEEIDEYGNYRKVERPVSVEHALEFGPFFRPFPQKPKKPKPEKKKKKKRIFG